VKSGESDYTIAIAIRDIELHLEASIVRKSASDVYLNFHRDHDPTWKPHASYHASGQFHHKSYGGSSRRLSRGASGCTQRHIQQVIRYSPYGRHDASC
jgi:hypothetical protein